MNSCAITFDNVVDEISRMVPCGRYNVIPRYNLLSNHKLKQIITSLPAQVDAVILEVYDPWHLSKKLLSWLEAQPRHFYFFTLEYENQHISGNITKLCINRSWFGLDRVARQCLPTELSMGFSCLNNKAHAHRILLGAKLFKANLLKDVIFTQGLEELGCITVEQKIRLCQHDPKGLYRKILPLEDGEYVDQDYGIDHRAYHAAYCNIATETTAESVPLISEKSYKPFLSLQVPLWLAFPGHMAYLESLGFECMRDLVPSDYDCIGVEAKTDYIVNIVRQGREFIQDFYFEHWREIKHNHELVISDKIGVMTFEKIKSFFQDNT